MSQVNVELGLSATATISLNDTAVRNLAGVGSGQIGMNNLQGKSNVFAFAIASNQIDANLRTLAVNAGWNGTTPVQATINGGVWISGSAQANSTPALTINGSFPNGVTLINNGAIVGRGGDGGGGQAPYGTGTAGGLALGVSVGVTIQNNGTIAGGGGGGNGGGYGATTVYTSCNMSEDFSGGAVAGGGGGGGGRSNVSFNSSGGAAGSGGSGIGCSPSRVAAAGGAGTSGGAGGGGLGDIFTCTCPGSGTSTGGTGGTGGDWGTASGGGAGYAVSGNGNISWTAFGTRLGPIG
jgi:hypothetical protein